MQRFEQEIASYLEVPAAAVTTVNSGTAAVHLAVQAVLSPGDEVLVQSLTYVATYQAISAAGVIPVSCEVLPQTATIDLVDAERRITARTRAIMPVHYASNPGDLRSVYDFAARHRLRVIEDAAHAFGCRHDGKMIGSSADVACFSFDGIKNITSGEGGIVVTSDPAVQGKVKDARLLGVEKDTDKRYQGQRSWEFDVRAQGYRYHMSNVFAAIGRVQLHRLPSEFAPARVALARRYRELLSGVRGVCMFETDLDRIIPHIQPIRILEGKRDPVRAALESSGVQTGIHYKPNHLLTLYGAGDPALPVTERLYEEILSLPLHPGVSVDDVTAICEHLRRALDAA